MTKKRIYFVILCLILCFIWGNSLLSREVSGAISHFIADILGGEQGATDEGHHLLRKAAHFCEFASLGAVFFLWLREKLGNSSTSLTMLTSCALVGVSVPLIDETIQIFSQRGPALADVWIDISGYAAGTLICLVILRIIARAVREKTTVEKS